MAGRLVIDFGSDRAVDHFVRWMSGAGEQHYWDWMEFRELEEQGPITATKFDYGGYKPTALGTWGMTATLGRVSERRR